eukprot:GEMP01010742.1.p1 GENE.GEMP01010742.1~~GEMP01010742.1.p1  ORF type:complete len:630 (+),score=113.69 GEMP01010742.1:96-1892(+)
MQGFVEGLSRWEQSERLFSAVKLFDVGDRRYAVWHVGPKFLIHHWLVDEMPTGFHIITPGPSGPIEEMETKLMGCLQGPPLAENVMRTLPTIYHCDDKRLMAAVEWEHLWRSNNQGVPQDEARTIISALTKHDVKLDYPLLVAVELEDGGMKLVGAKTAIPYKDSITPDALHIHTIYQVKRATFDEKALISKHLRAARASCSALYRIDTATTSGDLRWTRGPFGFLELNWTMPTDRLIFDARGNDGGLRLCRMDDFEVNVLLRGPDEWGSFRCLSMGDADTRREECENGKENLEPIRLLECLLEEARCPSNIPHVGMSFEDFDKGFTVFLDSEFEEHEDFIDRLWLFFAMKSPVIPGCAPLVRHWIKRVHRDIENGTISPYVRKNNPSKMAKWVRKTLAENKGRKHWQWSGAWDTASTSCRSSSTACDHEADIAQFVDNDQQLLHLVADMGLEALRNAALRQLLHDGYARPQDLEPLTNCPLLANQLFGILGLQHVCNLASLCHKLGLPWDAINKLVVHAAAFYGADLYGYRQMPIFSVALTHVSASNMVAKTLPYFSPVRVFARAPAGTLRYTLIKNADMVSYTLDALTQNNLVPEE